MKIGIMGGTFNPIHQGHLIQGEIVREKRGLDKIIFLPSGNPPHKREGNVLDVHIRKTMVEIAIESNPYFHISELEIYRPGLSYTVDTMEEFKTLYPEDDLYLILGKDSLLEIHKWKDYEKILSTVNILVVDRLKSKSGSLEDKIEKYRELYGSKIEKIESPIIQISSTDIRKRLSRGQSIKYMVPESVEKYIEKNHFYTGEEI